MSFEKGWVNFNNVSTNFIVNKSENYSYTKIYIY